MSFLLFSSLLLRVFVLPYSSSGRRPPPPPHSSSIFSMLTWLPDGDDGWHAVQRRAQDVADVHVSNPAGNVHVRPDEHVRAAGGGGVGGSGDKIQLILGRIPAGRAGQVAAQEHGEVHQRLGRPGRDPIEKMEPKLVAHIEI